MLGLALNRDMLCQSSSDNPVQNASAALKIDGVIRNTTPETTGSFSDSSRLTLGCLVVSTNYRSIETFSQPVHSTPKTNSQY